MRILLFIIFSLAMCTQTLAQSDALAQQYYEKGEYKKAIVAFEKLYNKSPRKINFFIYFAFKCRFFALENMFG